jgi:pyruvate dehydrogenase E1 component alpha subunit
VQQKLVTPAELKDIDKKIQAVVDDAIEFALESPEPDPADLYKYVFAEDE